MHGKMFKHDGAIEVAGIHLHSELVILLLSNHKTVYSRSGICTLLNDFQLLHSLKLLFKRLTKGHGSPTGKVHNRGSIRLNWNLRLASSYLTQALELVCIFGFQVLFVMAVYLLYQA